MRQSSRQSPRFNHLRLLLIGLHVLSGALQVALLFPFGGSAGRQFLRQNWSRQLLTLLGIRIEAVDGGLSGVENGLLVCNHISFIDIFVINALLPSGFVAKRDVAQWPLIGWLCRHNDTVFIERGSRRAAHSTHQEMLAAFGAGKRLVVFPEGTTTAGDYLLPFHAALFQSAIDAAVPVHAVALSYHRADGLRSAAPAYIDDVSLVACLMTVLRTRGLTARIALAASFVPPLPERRHLARHAQHAVAAALAQSPNFAPTPGRPDFGPWIRGTNPREGSPQPLSNTAAIRR
ncbi:MAG: 1-acyl-sn-glycerol-3-phosphate acyltransferase [Rhodocyclaceae bacterium]|nr:MAG: 1-acyl-sn-glycerol-3-phosphate acyltransferase [Rhodocyclaceae bacterium]TND01693.1 MAG: 1-acyl-sn-glycerol-3-phosphate acyltransferase [Rhodocyclaceae bacterium]